MRSPRSLSLLLGLAGLTFLPAAFVTGALVSSFPLSAIFGWSLFFLSWIAASAGIAVVVHWLRWSWQPFQRVGWLLASCTIVFAPSTLLTAAVLRLSVEWLGLRLSETCLAVGGMVIWVAATITLGWLIAQWHRRRVLAITTLIAVAVLYAIIVSWPGDIAGSVERTRTIQTLERIALAARIYFANHPEQVLVHFDDLVGQGRSGSGIDASYGEDYRRLFPLHIDFTELAVSSATGAGVILWLPSDGPITGFWRDQQGQLRVHRPKASVLFIKNADGRLRAGDNTQESLPARLLAAYAARATSHLRDGVERIPLSDVRRKSKQPLSSR